MGGSTPGVDADYARRTVIGAPRERVFDAVATAAGLRAWWTPIVRGPDAAGNQVRLELDGLDEHIVLRVDAETRPSSVVWACVTHTGHPDWDGSELRFELAEQAPGACELDFRHVGLAPRLDCYDVCEAGWDRFLASLVADVERGEGRPFGS